MDHPYWRISEILYYNRWIRPETHELLQCFPSYWLHSIPLTLQNAMCRLFGNKLELNLKCHTAKPASSPLTIFSMIFNSKVLRRISMDLKYLSTLKSVKSEKNTSNLHVKIDVKVKEGTCHSSQSHQNLELRMSIWYLKCKHTCTSSEIWP